MNRPTKVLTIAALSAALTFAQGPGPGHRGGGTPLTAQQRIEMRVNFLATLLTLTADQKTRATSIFTEAQAASENARTNIQTTREALRDAIKKNDTASIDRLATTLGGVSGQLTAIESKAEAAFYALLTAEQKTKYDTTPRGGPAPMRGGPRGEFGGGNSR